jgi:hypothetical protein
VPTLQHWLPKFSSTENSVTAGAALWRQMDTAARPLDTSTPILFQSSGAWSSLCSLLRLMAIFSFGRDLIFVPLYIIQTKL